MMKKISAALILSAATVTVHAEFYSANDLLSKMDGNQQERAIALGYVMGIFDVMSGRVICAPESVTAGQVHDLVKKFILVTPEKRHLSADQYVAAILQASWPCRPTNSSPQLGARSL